MKKFLLFLPFVLLAAPMNNSFNQKNSKVNSFFMSDFGYVNDLFFKRAYKHYVKKNGKNFSVLFARISLGFNRKYWNIGVFKQEDFLLQTNKDTAKFVYQLLNHKALERKNYNIFIKLKGFETQGLYFNKILKFKNLKVMLANDLYEVTFMQDGTVDGNGVIIDEKNYEYYAHTQYYYSKNLLYKRKVKYQNGYGYNFHLGIKYKKNNFTLRILMNNLISFIKINNTPYSNVYLNSNNKHYKNGYITYSPLFYGKEYYKDYKGSFDKKYDFLIMKRKIYIEYFKWKKLNLKYIGYKNKNLNIAYEFRNKSISFKYITDKFFLNIESDKINYKKAKIIAFSCGINITF